MADDVKPKDTIVDIVKPNDTIVDTCKTKRQSG